MNCTTFNRLANRTSNNGLDERAVDAFAAHPRDCQRCAVFLVTKVWLDERGIGLLLADMNEVRRRKVAEN